MIKPRIFTIALGIVLAGYLHAAMPPQELDLVSRGRINAAQQVQINGLYVSNGSVWTALGGYVTTNGTAANSLLFGGISVSGMTVSNDTRYLGITSNAANSLLLGGLTFPTILTNNSSGVTLYSTTPGTVDNGLLVNAGFVRSLLQSGTFFYNSSNLVAGSFIRGVQAFQYQPTVDATISTRTYTAVTNNQYIGATMTTQTFTSVSGPATIEAYLTKSIAGSATVSPEIYFTIDGTNTFGDYSGAAQTIATGTNLYSWVMAFPTTTTNVPFRVVRQLKVVSQTANPDITLSVGGARDSRISFGIPNTHDSTFVAINNGTATNLTTVGLTNNGAFTSLGGSISLLTNGSLSTVTVNGAGTTINSTLTAPNATSSAPSDIANNSTLNARYGEVNWYGSQLLYTTYRLGGGLISSPAFFPFLQDAGHVIYGLELKASNQSSANALTPRSWPSGCTVETTATIAFGSLSQIGGSNTLGTWTSHISTNGGSAISTITAIPITHTSSNYFRDVTWTNTYPAASSNALARMVLMRHQSPGTGGTNDSIWVMFMRHRLIQ